MKRVEYVGGWLELNEPGDISVKARRHLQSASGAASAPMQRLQAATDRELAKLNLPEGQTPTREQIEEAQRKGQPEPPLTERELDYILSLEQVSLVATIKAWSREEPPNLDSIENMPYGQYGPILDAADDARTAILEGMTVDFEPGDGTQRPNPRDEIPFGGSNDSRPPD